MGGALTKAGRPCEKMQWGSRKAPAVPHGPPWAQNGPTCFTVVLAGPEPLRGVCFTWSSGGKVKHMQNMKQPQTIQTTYRNS